MPSRIAAFCVRTGQRPPENQAGFVRCIMESLAIAHRDAISDAVRLSGHPVEVVHLVGGGARNPMLCQLTADATGLPVIAGPAEATALGNVLIQARAAGGPAALPTARELIRHTQRLLRYEPRGDQTGWDKAAARVGLG